MGAFADDLERYLNDEPVTARPDSRSYRMRKFVQRHRLGVGAASATLLALIAGVIGTTWQAIEARRERDAALFQAERAFAKGNLVNLMLGAIGDTDRPLTQREILERSVALDRETVHERSADRRRSAAADRGSIPHARRYRTRIRGDATRRRDCDRER